MNDLYYEDVGVNANTNALPLVLLHGWTLNGAVWGDARERLAERFPLRIIDLPGHGRSAHTEFKSLSDATARVAACLPHRCNLLGFSMGGMVAQQLIASEHRNNINRLILLSTTPKFIHTEDWPCGVQVSVLSAFADRLASNHQKTMMEFLILQALNSPDARRQILRLRENLAERGGLHQSVLTTGIAALMDVDLRAYATAINTPTLLMGGERDTLTPPDALRWLAQTIPNANLLMFADGAHALFLSHTLAFCDAITAFLANDD
jgi:pimeloyl-[acyl-carrier protein] methyl ester esterase